MKNRLFTLSLIVIAVTVFTSCASRKYGCPNSTGMKVEKKAQGMTA